MGAHGYTAPGGTASAAAADGRGPAGDRAKRDGIALGGIRTPPLDVPVDVLSGEPGPSSDLFCLLMGSTVPLAAERLAELYPSSEQYQDRYDAAVEEVIDAGFVLPEDAEALVGYSDSSLVAD